MNLADKLAKELFGLTRKEAIAKKICVKCKKKELKFEDKQSEKEYFLSGFCQQCQNEYFEN